jgi:ABC-type antimicrobial peptide transport system permease subunit
MAPVTAGLVLGLVGAGALTRLVAQELFGVTSGDLATHAVAVTLVLLAAVAALVLPARRATRVDPVVVLRDS